MSKLCHLLNVYRFCPIPSLDFINSVLNNLVNKSSSHPLYLNRDYLDATNGDNLKRRRRIRFIPSRDLLLRDTSGFVGWTRFAGKLLFK